MADFIHSSPVTMFTQVVSSSVVATTGSTTATTTSAATRVVATSTSSPRCFPAIPDHYGHAPIGACNSHYLYDPSFSGNLVFAILFGLTTLVHLQQAFYFRKGYCWVIVTAGLSESIAFVVRTVGAHNQQQQELVPGSNLLFLLAPLWITAFVYMTFSRFVRQAIPDGKDWHHRGWVSKVYFGTILTAAGVQVAACGIMFAMDATVFSAAQKAYMAGIAVQGIFILEFMLAASRTYIKVLEADCLARSTSRIKGPLMWTIYAALLLLAIRIIFRLADLGLGETTSNPMATSEMYVLFLDALPMLLALVLFNVCHPGLVLSLETRRAHNRDTKDVVDSAGRRAEIAGLVPQHAHSLVASEVPPPPRYEPSQMSNSSLVGSDPVRQHVARGASSDSDSEDDLEGSLRGHTVTDHRAAPAEKSADLGEDVPTRTWMTG